MEERSNNRRVLIFISAIFFLLIAVSVANARVERNYRNSASEHLSFVVDSIDFRQDLTRLYGRVLGRPHTSQRIDGIKMNTQSSSCEATDIDGVDFKRWFQWEDDGVIPVEVDFQAMKPVDDGSLVIVSARGTDVIKFTR